MLITVRQFSEMSEALMAQGCLDSAGIESFLADTNVTRVDWPLTRGMRLQVEAADAQAADSVLCDATSHPARTEPSNSPEPSPES
jgi:hypothetical protein